MIAVTVIALGVLALFAAIVAYFAIRARRAARGFSVDKLLREYRSPRAAAKTGTLRLYKSGTFELQLRFQRAENELGISQFSRTGTWRETAAGLQLVASDGKSAELGQQEGGPTTLAVTSDFPTFETDADLAIAGLVFTATSEQSR
jgi:hypothetical protein